MPHWVFFLSAANALVGVFTWRNLPLTVVRLVGALTKDPERSKRCAEILRLARKDAKELPSYLDSPGDCQPPATAVRRTQKAAGRECVRKSSSAARARSSRRKTRPSPE